MSFEMTPEQVRSYCERNNLRVPQALNACHKQAPKRQKYGNKRTLVDGITFDSAREAKRWQELQLLLKAGEILGVFRQHPFRLQGCVYISDFVILQKDGTFCVEDAKGFKTKEYKIKKRQMKEVYNIEIREV